MNCRTKRAQTISFGTKKQAETVVIGTSKQAKTVKKQAETIRSLPKRRDRDEECNSEVEFIRAFGDRAKRNIFIAYNDNCDPTDKAAESLSLSETESETSTASTQLNRLNSEAPYIVTSFSDGGCGVEASNSSIDNIKGESKGKTQEPLISTEPTITKQRLAKQSLTKPTTVKSTSVSKDERRGTGKGDLNGRWKGSSEGPGKGQKKDLNRGEIKGVVRGIIKSVRSFESKKIIGKVRDLAQKRGVLLSAVIHYVKRTVGKELQPENTFYNVISDKDCSDDGSKDVSRSPECGGVGGAYDEEEKIEYGVTNYMISSTAFRLGSMSTSLKKDWDERKSANDEPEDIQRSTSIATTSSTIDTAVKMKPQQEDSSDIINKEDDVDSEMSYSCFSMSLLSNKPAEEEGDIDNLVCPSLCFHMNTSAKKKKQVQPEASVGNDEEYDHDPVASYPADEVLDMLIVVPLARKTMSSITRSKEDDMDSLLVEKFGRHSARFNEEAVMFVYNGAESAAAAPYFRRRRRLQQPAAVANDDDSCIAVQLDALGESFDVVINSLEMLWGRIWPV
jgi:hypothetical protein